MGQLLPMAPWTKNPVLPFIPVSGVRTVVTTHYAVSTSTHLAATVSALYFPCPVHTWGPLPKHGALPTHWVLPNSLSSMRASVTGMCHLPVLWVCLGCSTPTLGFAGKCSSPIIPLRCIKKYDSAGRTARHTCGWAPTAQTLFVSS